jgi:hypothetical protein
MIKLHANMHGYRPDRALDWLRPAMKVCAKYNIVVLIHTGDGPFTIPTMFYPIIREFPMVNFIIAHFGIRPVATIRSRRSGWPWTPKRVCRIRLVLPGAHCRVCQGTAAQQDRVRHRQPPNEPGMWLRELEMLCRPAPHGIDLDEDAGRLPGQQHCATSGH